LVFSVELNGAWSGLRTRTEALGRILDRLGEQLCARDRFRDIAGPETAQGGPVERPRPQRARGLVPGERERAAAKAKGRISAVLSPGPPLAYRAPRLAERGGSRPNSAPQGSLRSTAPSPACLLDLCPVANPARQARFRFAIDERQSGGSHRLSR